MQVSKWGNSLAVRLPASIVEALHLKEGDDISIDGFTGEVFAGPIATRPSEVVQVLIEKRLAPEKSEVYRRFKQVMEAGEFTPV